MALPVFELSDEEGFQAFLRGSPRAIVLFRGIGCPYSRTFEAAFVEIEPPEGYARAIRRVEEGGHGPVAEALGVDVTPSVREYREAAGASRLPGRILVGIPRTAYKRWLKSLSG